MARRNNSSKSPLPSLPSEAPEALAALHPLLRRWVKKSFGRLTQAQELTLPHILAGRSVLLSSPTGTGKTLAGFLGILDHLVRAHEAGTLGHGTQAVYVSPLRALTYDIQKNLSAPLAGMGLSDVIRVGLRTGDTSASDRAKLRRKPPHILLTTPESLAILLPQASHAEALSRCRYVIVDELHALAENKRGAHLTLSLERLENLVPSLTRIGLSATAAPLPLLGKLLVGTERDCEIAEARIERRRRVEV
ncbi:MAG: DEAD/DEAH box helicase, partial [Prosthecobacter sp.]|nr:DEAD/DEAH box helicase [Prosthecobacter sp.]